MVSERDSFVAQCDDLQGELLDLRTKVAAAAEAAQAETEAFRSQATQAEAQLRAEYTAQLGEAAATYAR